METIYPPVSVQMFRFTATVSLILEGPSLPSASGLQWYGRSELYLDCFVILGQIHGGLSLPPASGLDSKSFLKFQHVMKLHLYCHANIFIHYFQSKRLDLLLL